MSLRPEEIDHINLVNWFKSNFGLINFHYWSLSDIERMIPWEKQVYVGMLDNHLREQERTARELAAGKR